SAALVAPDHHPRIQRRAMDRRRLGRQPTGRGIYLHAHRRLRRTERWTLMKRHTFMWIIPSLLAAGMLSFVSCSNKKSEDAAAKQVAADSANAPRVVPGAVQATEITAVSTVTAVDSAKRTVSLLNAAGETHVYKCGPEVRN